MQVRYNPLDVPVRYRTLVVLGYPARNVVEEGAISEAPIARVKSEVHADEELYIFNNEKHCLEVGAYAGDVAIQLVDNSECLLGKTVRLLKSLGLRAGFREAGFENRGEVFLDKLYLEAASVTGQVLKAATQAEQPPAIVVLEDPLAGNRTGRKPKMCLNLLDNQKPRAQDSVVISDRAAHLIEASGQLLGDTIETIQSTVSPDDNLKKALAKLCREYEAVIRRASQLIERQEKRKLVRQKLETV